MGRTLVDLTLSDEDSKSGERGGSHSAVRRPRAPTQTRRLGTNQQDSIVISSDDDSLPPITSSNHDRVTSKSAAQSDRTASHLTRSDDLTGRVEAGYDPERPMARPVSNGAQEPRSASTTGIGFFTASESGRNFGFPRQRQRPRDEPNYWKEKKTLTPETPGSASSAPSKIENEALAAIDDSRRQSTRSNGPLDGEKRVIAARKSSQQSYATFDPVRPAQSALVGESAPRKRKRSSGEQLSQFVKPKDPRLSATDVLETGKPTRQALQNDSRKSTKTSEQGRSPSDLETESVFPKGHPNPKDSGDHDRENLKFGKIPPGRQEQAKSRPRSSQGGRNGVLDAQDTSERENLLPPAAQELDRGRLQSKTIGSGESGTFKIPERPASEKTHEKTSSIQADASHMDSQPSRILKEEDLHAMSTSTIQDLPVETPLTLSATEALLKKYVNELQEDHELFLRSWLRRARNCFQPGSTETHSNSMTNLSKGITKMDQRFVHASSPFTSLKPVSTRISGKANEKEHVYLTQDVMYDKSTNHKSVRSFLSVRVTGSKHERLTVPEYTSYVGLRQNVLAENDQKLLYWPYMGDNADETALQEELVDKFNPLIEDRDRRLQLAAQTQKYQPYVQDFLADLGCSMNDVLRFLLEPVLSADGQLTDNVKQAVLARDRYCKEDFDRSSKRLVLLLSKLPPSSDRAMAAAALACQSFANICKFNIWHVAWESIRDGSEARDTNDTSALENVATTETDFQYRHLGCRICHLHNCTYHGEYREKPHSDGDEYDSDNASMSSEHSLDLGDVERINFKKLVNVEPRHDQQHSEYSPHSRTLPRRGYSYWIQRSSTHLLHDREPFYPCSHEGTCEEAQCRCFRTKVTCEKSCACPPDCERRFRGCQCAQRGKVCFQNPHCDCYRLNRECDADLCKTCGAAEVLDPANRYSKEVAKGKCANAHIQRNLPKRTLLGHSEVQGFGLYMGEQVKAHEYVGEYKGEVITKGEADRRGAIYAHLATNYLFSLNKGQEVDSTKAGNKMRFVNNSEREDTMNCYAQTMLCNSVTRIGMYAKRDIAVGEELFFNYGYPKAITKHFWEKGEKPKKAKGTNRGKWRASTTFVSDHEDLATGSGAGRAAGKKAKYKLDKDGKLVKRKSNAGGARPGAGRKPKNRPPSGANIGIIPPNPSTSSVTQMKDKGKGKSTLAAIETSPSPGSLPRTPQMRTVKTKWKGWVIDEPDDGLSARRENRYDNGEIDAVAGAPEEELPLASSVEDSDEDSEYRDDDEEDRPRRRGRRGWRKAR